MQTNDKLYEIKRLTISGVIFDEYILGLPVGGKVLKCIESKLFTQRVFHYHAAQCLFSFTVSKLSYA